MEGMLLAILETYYSIKKPHWGLFSIAVIGCSDEPSS